ncbi:hypothetical protein ANN_23101 [Periplaneta americana]|uniref:Craniofacial development protein 2-like n=1 Tax=Periplaneta americana TaxID=6978 RepID=A0ABQ8SL11_PERAM|nr:hypothetical protein ANN_23101 [Periplaneta americana]
MNDVIDNPVDCEVRSVIRFLNARHLKPAEIYRQLKEVYGDIVMNERNGWRKPKSRTVMPPGNGGCAKTSTPLSSGGSKQAATIPPPSSSPVATASDAVPQGGGGGGGGSSSSSSSSGSEDATTEKTPSPQKGDAAVAQASNKTKKEGSSKKKGRNKEDTREGHIMKQPNREKKRRLRIGTWNIRTLLQAGKLENLKKEMRRNKVDVMGISEVRWENSGSCHGVGVLLGPRVKAILVRYVDDRMIMVRLQGEKWTMDLVLVQVCMPHSGLADEKAEESYDKIKDIAEKETKGAYDLAIEDEAVVSEDEKGFSVLREEVELVLKEMKNGKATGVHGIPIELVNCLGEDKKEIVSLCNEIYE